VLEWNCPWAKWFSGGQINLSYNCLDRHVATWRRNKAALIWEGEPGEVRRSPTSNCSKSRNSPTF
jgi:acetyl-CoA synthetase